MSLGTPTILLVDDEDDVLQMYAAKLREGGFKTYTSLDGYEGLDAAKREQPDLVLLDMLMPGMSGVETLVEMRDDPQLVEMPVAMLTAVNPTEEEKTKIQELGVVDIVDKELDLDTFLETVQRLTNVLPSK